MVAPVVAAAAVSGGIQIASAIAQHYQAEKARKASAKRLEEIEAIWRKVVPPEYNLDIEDPPQLIARQISAPELNLEALNPEDYKVVERFSPALAKTVAEQRPELVRETRGEAVGTEAMESALQEMMRVSRGGFDPIADARMRQVQRQTAGDAARNRAAVLESAARRGVLDSTATLAAQLQGQEADQERAAMLQQQALADAQQRRLQALMNMSSMGQNMGQFARQREAANVGILNDFNQRMSARAQAQENRRADALNRAEAYNVQTAQTAADRNVNIDWEAQRYNREMLNSGQITEAEFKQRERQLYNDALMQQHNARLAREKYLNDLRQQQFRDQATKAQGEMGIVERQRQDDMASARDRQKTIQAVGDVGSKTAQMGGAYYAGQSGGLQNPPTQNKANIFNVPDPFEDQPKDNYQDDRYDASIYDPNRTA